MTKTTKRIKEYQKAVDPTKHYPLKEAVTMLKGLPHAKFDETVDMAFKLNIDTSKGPQSVRGNVVLPHGTGKKVRIIVFCKHDHISAAKEAGADEAGDKELIDKVAGGWTDFDVAVSMPEMMKDVSRLGKMLGPRGLMPSPKAGTVTDDVATAVKELKTGKMEFKMDKQLNVMVPVGKMSFTPEQLLENAKKLIDAISKVQTSATKGAFIKSLAISSTQGPGIRINTSQIG